MCWTCSSSFTRSMGATAVFEIAAATPPATKSFIKATGSAKDMLALRHVLNGPKHLKLCGGTHSNNPAVQLLHTQRGRVSWRRRELSRTPIRYVAARNTCTNDSAKRHTTFVTFAVAAYPTLNSTRHLIREITNSSNELYFRPVDGEEYIDAVGRREHKKITDKKRRKQQKCL